MSQINLLTINDKEYPELLKKIYDPPKELYIKGETAALNNKCLAIVGTRTATDYGKRIARQFANELAQCGFTIVSGLAEGIDTEAHAGALEAGGKTIAVFGCGIDKVFPPENLELAEKIEKNGALVSEYQPGSLAAKWTFPRRNRIISGLSLGVVMVEGSYESGAMITAKLALDEGREVFAVPGNIEIDQTKGPHWLIKQGAKLAGNVDDILEEFNIKRVTGSEKAKELDYSQLSSDEVKIISCLTKEPKHIDEISAKSEMETQEALSILSILEIKKLIKQVPGKYFVIW
jgi:DNA processing protein